MAFIQERQRADPRSLRGKTLAERLLALEKKERLAERVEITEERKKEFKWPFKWRKKFIASKRKRYDDMMLVIFLNKKNEIEPPKFMPIFDGNMVIWKNKPYEFDPRAVWTVKGIRGNPKAYLIKEIDRRPVMNKFRKYVYQDAAVSNMDLAEIRERGDSTESDEFLIKAALKAQTSQATAGLKTGAIVIIAIIIVGTIIYLFSGTPTA